MTTPQGYWQPGDEPGGRIFVSLADGRFALEGGGVLDSVTVAYESWGTLNTAKSNAVLVLHALTGDSHATGDAGPGHATPGWWNGLIGPGLAIDTDEFFVVCPNVLGGAQGTTGPSSLDENSRHFGSRFPHITVRDQVAVEFALMCALDIPLWHGVIGGSMGGMRALEWVVSYPEHVNRAVVLAVGAASTADEIALSSLQIRAIRADPNFLDGDYYERGPGPLDGLAIARGLGQVTYRSSNEFESRFGRSTQGDGDALRGAQYAIESYIGYHGEKLGRRFDPNSYIVLSDAMNHHDVGRGRGGVAAALATVRSHVTVLGIDSDRLYPLWLQHELVRFIPDAEPLFVITSNVGHDGFLLELDQIGKVVREALES